MGAVAKTYGAYRDSDGVCERALFVIAENGSIAWSYCSPLAVPAPTAFSMHWTHYPRWRKKMTRLKVPVSSHDHIQGSNSALITLVEYGDYQCPHCGAAQPVLKQIQARCGERLRLVFRHFPLGEIHPLAGPAAEAAEFAGSHGQFWQMHDAIFANQHRLSVPLLITLATTLGLSHIELRDALASGTTPIKYRAISLVTYEAA
jgi:Thioredoxin